MNIDIFNLISLLCIIYNSISITLSAELGAGSLPFTCGDGSPFGSPYNCNLPPPYPKDRRKNENTVRIMQFNADSLFLEGCSGWNKFDPRIPQARTPVGAMSHLQTIANTIYKLNADIIIIDEVCDCCVLRELIRHMNRNHMSQTYQEYMLQTNEENGIYFIPLILAHFYLQFDNDNDSRITNYTLPKVSMWVLLQGLILLIFGIVILYQNN